MTPAPAVPISGMLQLIGANDKAAAPPAAPGEAIPEEDPQKSVDMLLGGLFIRNFSPFTVGYPTHCQSGGHSALFLDEGQDGEWEGGWWWLWS